ncbi:unnamed protein product [Rotaria sp. Silwood2]|nr:unnamed protein product [Rotaria sp. Silwood2]
MSITYNDRKNFRSFVLNLKSLNSTWSVGRIARFIQNSDNPPHLKYTSLYKCVSRILKRETINDKKRSGRPVTVTTSEFRKNVDKCIRLKKNASIRKTDAILKRQGFTSSETSIYRTVKALNLKWYKKRKSQKLSDIDKKNRVKCAKTLRSKLGISKNSNKWRWNRIVNCDFSDLFTFQGFQNKKNDGVWAREGEEIEAGLINAQTEKFQKGILFWGAISSQGLIPSRAPINVTQWLEQQRTPCDDKRKRVYLTSQLYAKFLTEKAAPAIKTVFRKCKLNPIFHDDQDQKQRTILVRDTVAALFSEHIEPADGDAKFADVWRIENVWGALKEKLRGKNSGLGNIVNPIMSLATPGVYSLPMLLLIGWRGEPGKRDEPQHRIQGPATPGILAALGIPFQPLPDYHDGAGQALETAKRYMETAKGPYALLVKRQTFLPYSLPKRSADLEAGLSLTREEALQCVISHFQHRDVVVGTTGMLSRELFELRMKRDDGHERDFLTVGGMGHASSIALGIAIQKPNRTIYCLDGDGAVLMHMGILANIAAAAPSNFKHIVFNNGTHDSVGGQPTVAGDHKQFSLCHIAQGCGYKHVMIATNQNEIKEAMEKMRTINNDGPVLLELRIKTGHRKNLGRPTRSTNENRKDFMHFLQLS